MSREDFRPLDWAGKGIPREEAARWSSNGFTLADALRWRENFDVDEAERWHKAHVRNPGEARSWRVAGVTPDQVGAWREAGIGFAEASAWREFGYDLDEARRLKAEGKTPSDSFLNRVQKMRSRPGRQSARMSSAVQFQFSGSGGPGAHPAHTFIQKFRGLRGNLVHGYLTRQWFDEEAFAWAEAGIEASDALIWKEFGVAPGDAARLVKSGETTAAVLRAWWEAGIPPAEVGSWLGAGFTPEEAAAQRAQGVSADRAAVLRSLRDPDAG